MSAAPPPPAGRKSPAEPRHLAEWATLGVSILLIVGLAGYLVFQMTLPQTEYVAAEARPLPDQVRRAGPLYVLPVEVRNRGHRTLQDVKVEVRSMPPGGPPETRELLLDYLPAQSEQRIYVYFRRPPRAQHVQAQTLFYRLD